MLKVLRGDPPLRVMHIELCMSSQEPTPKAFQETPAESHALPP